MKENKKDWKSSLHFGHVVDVWAQPYYAGLGTNLPEVIPLFQKSSSPAISWMKDETKMPTSTEVASQMKSAGMRHVLMSAWNRPGRELIPNSYVLDEFCVKHPHSFSGLISVDIGVGKDISAQCAKIDQLVKKYGKNTVRGVRIVPCLWDMAPTHRLYYPILLKCVEHDIPFCTQVGHTGPLCPSDVGRPIPHIDTIALEFPALKVVGGHIGIPWLNEMISCMWKHENVYIDTSAYLPTYYPQELVQYMDTSLGRKKVMFGTNYPQLTWEMCVKQTVEKIGPLVKDSTMKAFLYGNANQVFKLTSPSSKL